MRRSLLAAAALGVLALMSACTATEKLPNGCVVKAIHHQQVVHANRLVGNQRRADGVLAVSFMNRRIGHAVSVFEYNEKLWAYDPELGTRMISARKGDSWKKPSHLARLAFPTERVLYAAWL